jgi:hypothetical protein
MTDLWLASSGFDKKCKTARKCTHLQSHIQRLNVECCDEPSERCSNGAPETCNADCAIVFLAFQEDCGAQLSSAIQARFKHVAQKCLATLKGGVAPPPPIVVPPMIASSGDCQLSGGTCGSCLHIHGCEWCELHQRCYNIGQSTCRSMDIRNTINYVGGNKTITKYLRKVDSHALGSGYTHLPTTGCSVQAPCKACEGDCNKDDDCARGLKCFQRHGRHIQVPGCTSGFAGDSSSLDYCIMPTAPKVPDKSTIHLRKSKTGCSPQKPCGLCEADCDTDADCHIGLMCLQRSTWATVKSTTVPPGCLTNHKVHIDINNDFCVQWLPRTLDESCNNKCTSASCLAPNSVCDPQTGKCLCQPGYRVEGNAGHETLCVSVANENNFTKVASQCSDADSKYCGAASLAHPLFGCGTRAGYSTMVGYCQASCGTYCQAKPAACMDAASGVDYGAKYCLPITGQGSCTDTALIDTACPHHTIGRLVPQTCDDLSSTRDDACASVYTSWYTRCFHKVSTERTMRSIIAQYGAQLSAFNNQCKKTLAAQRLCPRGTKPGVGGYCTSLKGTCCNANYEGLSRKWVGGLSDKATCARFCSAEPACTGFSFGVWTDKKNYCNIFGPWWLLNPPSVAFSAWTNTPGSNAAIGGVCKGTAFAKYECVARAEGGSGGH